MYYKFPIACGLLVLVFFFEGTRIFQISGITPNLTIIFFGVLFTATVFGEQLRFWAILLLLSVFVILSQFLFNFWMESMFILSLCVIGMYIFRRKLAGTPPIDFLIVIVLGTLLFYAMQTVVQGIPFLFKVAILETFYNIVLGLCVWFITRRISQYYAKRS